MVVGVWTILAVWAVSLLVLRRLSFREGWTTSSDPGTVSDQEIPEPLRESVSQLFRDLEALAQRSTYANEIDQKSSRILSALPSAAGSIRETTLDGLSDDHAQPPLDQVVHPSDGFVKQPRRSGVPMMVPSDDLFCDQLFNTFTSLFAGDVPSDSVESWCRRGMLAQSEGEHLPPGVEDAHIVHFTLLQLYRRLYLTAQFQDRLTRYREVFDPMIRAMEKRHDRMLYNYI